jgi:tryptophan-rich hypothetical protein
LNRINPRKLANSKWTAVQPVNREKHFMVSKVTYDEEGMVTGCWLEAVLSRRLEQIDWRELKDSAQWVAGWK